MNVITIDSMKANKFEGSKKMKFEKISANVTKIYLKDWTILYSYNTPVAAVHTPTWKFYRTEEFHSVTTSKHINQWIESRIAEQKPQSFFEDLVKDL